jgi:phospholipid/cholesterol/gamma-HCH transport system substrate-binding protein
VRPFREQNKTVVGAVGLGVIVGLLGIATQTDKLPVIGCGSTYRADFSEAAGLRPQDEVRVAGVKIGKVKKVELYKGEVVRTELCLKGAQLGSQTRADIRIKTVLGRKFVMLTPEGAGTLSRKDVIPITRTSSPYDVSEAFQGLAATVDPINSDLLAQSFKVLSDDFRDTPDDVRASLTGLSRLSRTIASRDAELKQLLDRSRGVTQVLAARDQDLVQVLSDSSLLLQEVKRRRAAIHQLLVTTTDLSEQLVALVRENRAQLGPTLDRLHNVVVILQKNQSNLDRSLELLAPFTRLFANNLGNGRWFDTYIRNMTTFSPSPGVPLPLVAGKP